MPRSVLLLLLFAGQVSAATLHVGPGQTYSNLQSAVAAVQPGDTIEIHAGAYPGGLFFGNLKGTASHWITIRAAAGETVIFEGGGNAIQMSDPAYLHLNGRLRRLLFRGVLPAGMSRQHLQAQEPAGSYWLLIRIGEKSWTQKLILH